MSAGPRSAASFLRFARSRPRAGAAGGGRRGDAASVERARQVQRRDQGLQRQALRRGRAQLRGCGLREAEPRRALHRRALVGAGERPRARRRRLRARARRSRACRRTRSAPANDRLAALEGVLGAVSSSGPEGTRVQLDANTELPVPATLHGSAGVHTLSVRVAGRAHRAPPRGPRAREDVAKLDFATEPLPAPPTRGGERSRRRPPPPPPRRPAAGAVALRKRRSGFTTIGVGGALLLSGVVLRQRDHRGARRVPRRAHAGHVRPRVGARDVDERRVRRGRRPRGGRPRARPVAVAEHPAAAAARRSRRMRPRSRAGGLLLRGAF